MFWELHTKLHFIYQYYYEENNRAMVPELIVKKIKIK